MIDIQTGDVIFYKPRGPLSWIVSKITKSEYSHVALALDSDTIVEANWYIKSRVTHLDYNKKINSVYRLSSITQEQKEFIKDYAPTLVGVGYDYSQILGLLLRLVFHIKVPMLNQLNEFICSTIIDRIFIGAGIPRKNTNYEYNIAPQGLINDYDLHKLQN